MSSAKPTRPPPPSDVFTRFTAMHKEAFVTVNQALKYDEDGEHRAAFTLYNKGLTEIAAINALDCTQTTDNQKEQIKTIKEKLNSTKLYLEGRLVDMQPYAANNSGGQMSTSTVLPSYDEATGRSSSQPSSPVHSADVILEIPDAQIFHVSSEGYVTTPSYPDNLQICKFTHSTIPGAPQYFLQLGSWNYPLMEDLTPAIQSGPGAFVLPDKNEGDSIGLLLPDSTPTNLQNAFENYMFNLTNMRDSHAVSASSGTSYSSSRENNSGTSLSQSLGADNSSSKENTSSPATGSKASQSTSSNSTESNEETSSDEKTSTGAGHTIADRIVQGLSVVSEKVSYGLGKGSEYGGQFLSWGGVKVRSRLQPAQSDTEPNIDNRFTQGAIVARSVTNKAVIISAAVVKGLGEATVYLARQAAPYIKEKGSQIIPDNMKKSFTEKKQDGKSKLDDIISVAHAGVRSWGQIYLSLEEAAKAMGRSITSETSETMKHRYGVNAGVITENALFTVGNTVLSAHNIRNLGPKAVAKRAIKDTGKVLLEPKRSGSKDLQPT